MTALMDDKGEPRRSKVMTDADRIAFLEDWSKRSRTGISIEWTPEDGFRVMTFHKVDVGQPDIRSALDAAMALRLVSSQQRGE